MARPNIEDLITEWEPRLRASFLDAVSRIVDRARVIEIVRALERGDVDGAIIAAGIDAAAWRALQGDVEAAFGAGGQAGVSNIPAARSPSGGLVKILFDVRNLRAETRMRDYSATLVREIVSDQREALRVALTAGLERGDNPRTVALDLIGRVNPRTRKREGGVVGLTSAQEQWVQNYAAELADPDKMHGALGRAMRDKRFDATVRKAVDEGHTIPAETRQKMVAAYRVRALKMRGDTIGRTEAIRALHEGQDEGYRQAVDAGQVARSNIRKVWRSASDGRVRDTHRALNGESVGFDETFKSPSGANLKFPGDRDAPPAETINCRCWVEHRIDYLANLR